MSAPPATRSLLRHTRFVLRRQPARHASTAAETAVSKASEGLTRVTSSGGSAVSSAAERAKNALSSAGGRTGRVISFVECEFLKHNLSWEGNDQLTRSMQR
jgi:F-type H+-transporting ATPase subunit g